MMLILRILKILKFFSEMEISDENLEPKVPDLEPK